MPKKGRGGKGPFTHEADSHVVFGNEESTRKREKNEGTGKSAVKGDQFGTEDAPRKPDTRELIGGVSWTGKLPVNILSEHCQKQKWAKPEYTMSKTAGGFSSMVVLKSTNPKTGEMVTLHPFKLPLHMKHLADQPTAVEARHFAATFALFRVCSMKNVHLMLPPKYRDLWKKEFQDLKSADLKDRKGWMYEADPFAATEKNEEAQALIAKKREESEKQRIAESNNPVVSLAGNKTGQSTTGNQIWRGWSSAPKVELGKRIRTDIEKAVQKYTSWNSYDILLTEYQRTDIVNDLMKLGFRRSHVQEAVNECKDREETLEWLLIHIPEDDLPKWALPEGYTAGLSMASGNMKREAAIKRLAEGGYAFDLCARSFDEHDEDEAAAAEALQAMLVSSLNHSNNTRLNVSSLSLQHGGEDAALWGDELCSLKAIYGTHFNQIDRVTIEIQIAVSDHDAPFILRVRKSKLYPMLPPILNVLARGLPAYVRLSITQQAIEYAMADLLGEVMIFSLVEWLEGQISRIIETPGKLRNVLAATSVIEQVSRRRVYNGTGSARHHPNPISRGFDVSGSDDLLLKFRQRERMPQQVKIMDIRKKLPAWKLQEATVTAVHDHQITIIAGETGSGKSTQSVQFVLDDMIRCSLGATANIICTQPRRISAMGLADRVSAERCSNVGGEIGYAIRGESKKSKDTKITFVTTGVLLRRLQTAGESKDDIVAALADVSHVFVDEVHERSLDTDFLLILLKDVLARRNDLKLVLMSATLDAHAFNEYFGGDAALIHIEGRTYPIQDYFLDDIIRFTGFNPSKAPVGGIENMIEDLGMNINYELIRALVQAIDNDPDTDIHGGILIFLPGILEISRTLDALRSLPNTVALPLHASLTPNEQRRVFPPAPRGKRKIIAATNVAETSITIEDIIAVIDTGKVKETSFDSQNKMVRLQEVWASRAACKQRRGRAGRVQAGKCYKLFTRNAEAKMVERPEPEIRRVPLEQLCLSVRAIGVTDVAAFLSSALTPPDTLAVGGAIKLLDRMGALDGGYLTALGRHLSIIPADLRCAKLMIYGAIFGCLEPCLTIAAILTVRSPFLSPQSRRDESKAARTAFGPGQGDLICDLCAYEAWSERKNCKYSFRETKTWCDQNYLSFQTLNDISSNRSQYISSLKETGFLPFTYRASSTSTQPAEFALLRALIAGAFNPQIVRIDFPDKKYASSVSGAVELDPEARTIRFFSSPSSSTAQNTPPVASTSSSASPTPSKDLTVTAPAVPQTNTRVFIHPSSTLFTASSFPNNSLYLSYFTKLSTSKTFIRDITPFNAYSLLLFGGSIQLDTLGRGLVVDGWLKLRGWARIGVLVSRLRGILDAVLERRFEDPMGLEGRRVEEEVVQVVRRLVERDGLDN